jgi:hypothetical protein
MSCLRRGYNIGIGRCVWEMSDKNQQMKYYALDINSLIKNERDLWIFREVTL